MEDTTVWVDMKIMRGPRHGKFGYVLNLRAHPSIEEYSKQRSQGVTENAADYAGHWINANNPEELLKIYSYVQGNQSAYAMDFPGQPMFVPRPRNRDNEILRGVNIPQDEGFGKVNLSILKLVGISNPDGVTIGFEGPVSFTYLKTLKAEFSPLVRSFVLDYITPIELNVQILSDPRNLR